MVFAAIVIGVLQVGLALTRLGEGRPPFDGANLLLGLVVIPVAAALLTLRNSWSWRAIAVRADELGNSRDRFQSYLEFSEQKSPHVLRDLALEETVAFARAVKIRPNWRMPKAVWGLIPLALIGVGLLVVFLSWSNSTKVTRAQAANLARDAAPKIAELAKKWEEPQLAKAAEALREQATAINERLSREPRQAALEALGKSEDAARAAVGNFSELQQSAQALASASDSTELREAIAEGDYLRAAEIARKTSAEQMQRAIEKAADAKNLPSLAQLKESSNPGEDAAQLLQQTARAAARNRDMERLLSALQDLKLEPGKGDDSKPSQSTEATESNAAIATVKSDPGAGASEDLAKSGASSQEGTGKSSGGGEGEVNRPDDSASSNEASGSKEVLASLIGPGDSLEDIVLSASDNSDAKRRYQEIFRAAQSDQISAVERETIPKSSRPLVKRYLESIRP